MRARKYYDAFRLNKSLLHAPFRQQFKIMLNILKFFNTNSKKPLIIKNKPVTAQIEPTSQCNLNCEMCIRKKVGVPIGTMPFQNFKKILDKLEGLYKVHLSGQGEPFLNPELMKMIKYANYKGILVMLNTNATVLTGEIINEICNAEIGEIAVSIDSPEKKNYEKIRKGANFERVIDNVKRLTSGLKRKKRKTVVSLAAVILKNNLSELPGFINLAKEVGAEKIVFQTIQEKEDYVKKYDIKTKTQMKIRKEEIKEQMNQIQKLGSKKGIVIVFDEGISPGCIWPWRGIYVTWNGNVTICCKILDYRNPVMGNLLEQGIWEIWNSKNYQMFRRLLRERKAPPACIQCNMV